MTKKVYPHGHRLRYTYNKCRCKECTTANTTYDLKRRQRKAAGIETMVDATRSREHVEWLAKQGMGFKGAARAAGLYPSVLSRLLYGSPHVGRPPTRRVRPETERKILAVTPDQATGYVRISSKKALHMIEELKSCNVSGRRIRVALGYSKGGSIAFERYDRMTARNIEKIESLHWALWKQSAVFREACTCEVPEKIRREFFEEAG